MKTIRTGVGIVRPRAVFYACVREVRMLDMIEFYRQDIAALEEIGYEVTRTTTLWAACRAPGDILYGWWWHRSVLAALVWRLRRRPVILTGATGLFESMEEGFFRHSVKLLLTALAVRFASDNIAISDVEAKVLSRLRAPRVDKICLSVDTGFFRPGPKDPAPTGIVVAQLFPRNIRRKGIDTAVRAALVIRESVPDFRLLVAGPSTADGRAVIDALRVCGDASGVVLLGELSRERKRALLAQAWFIVQPSIYEAFGLAVLEGMASGTVPVCSPAGGLAEVVGGVGPLVGPEDPGAVARAVLALVADAGRRKELSAAAREASLAFACPRRVERLAMLLDRARGRAGRG